MKKVRIIYSLIDPLTGFCNIGVIYPGGSDYYDYEITNRIDYDDILRMERKGLTHWINELKKWPYTKRPIKDQVHGS